MLTLNKLLERIDLTIPLDELVHQIINNFNIGNLVLFKPLLVGYEEVNCLLTTTHGKYIVKIFSKDKDLKTINSNVAALLEYHNGGIPVPKLYQYTEGNYLFKITENSDTYLIVMDYFDGGRFTEIQPTLKDKNNVVKILSDIHKLNYKTSANYDIWLTIHLIKEFDNKHRFLSPENFKLVNSTVQEFKTINFDKLSKSIVHFDLHRENVLKNSDGKYCILDLASTDYNYKVVDLATYLALFCTEFDKSANENIQIYKTVLEHYLTNSSLTNYEKEILLTLIKATFAANLLIPVFLQKTGRDENPEQTVYYKSMGKGGLEIFKDIDKL